MSVDARTRMAEALAATQTQLIDFFQALAEPDWQPAPGQWSFRQIAWHLATVEKACLLPRIEQIAAGKNPNFGIYLDTETEFNDRSLTSALEQWQATRQTVLDFVNVLSPEALAYTGYHPTFGRLTVLGYLQIFLAHDERHLAEMRQMAAKATSHQ